MPLERNNVLWASQEGDYDELRNKEGFRKSIHLRWFLKHKNFNRRNGVGREGKGVLREGYRKAE